MRLCEIAHAQLCKCELFGTASYLVLHWPAAATLTARCTSVPQSPAADAGQSTAAAAASGDCE